MLMACTVLPQFLLASCWSALFATFLKAPIPLRPIGYRGIGKLYANGRENLLIQRHPLLVKHWQPWVNYMYTPLVTSLVT
jgi:hypothetical protein